MLIRERNQYTSKKQQQIKLITKHFLKKFNKNRPLLPEILPATMKTLFIMSGEVQTAIKQLQNNRSAERDNNKPKEIKYGTENITKGIATIYKEIARTEKHPNETLTRN